MGKYIKYIREKKTLTIAELDKFLDSLIENNCEIIYYKETEVDFVTIKVTIVYGKLNKSIL